jgi:hypothetical protein
MKKLLALVLCVMMFVAVIPTSAFAATNWTATSSADHKQAEWQTGNWPVIDNPLMSVAQYTKEIKNMIGNTKTEIQSAYGVLVGDKVVYTAAKSMDDIIVGLVDKLANPMIEKGKYTTAAANNVKLEVRRLMDLLVTAEMTKSWKYTNGDGTIDPIKYAQTFANGVSAALNNKQFQKGYEAVATYFALSNLIADVNKQLSDQYADFANSVDGTFDKNFSKYYPALWTFYVDTFQDVKDFYALGAADGKEGAALDQWVNSVIDDPWADIQYAAAPDPFHTPVTGTSTVDGSDNGGDDMINLDS